MRSPAVHQLCLHIQKLTSAVLTLSKDLDQSLTAFTEFYRSFDSTDWRSINAEDRLNAFCEVSTFIKEGYLMCQRCRILGSYSESQLKTIFSSIYEVQNFFIEALKTSTTCNDVSAPQSTAKLLLLLMECANNGSLLDPRVGVGVWKFFSSLLQQHVGDLRNKRVCPNGVDFLDELLCPLIESTIHFYKCCLNEFTPNNFTTDQPPTTGGRVANLKMLNLLCRIATFCIKEFVAVSLPVTTGRPESNLLKWITWMIDTRYAGGSHCSGSGLPTEFVQHLETTMYLSTDVLLAHMTTIPPARQKETEYSSAAMWLHKATIQPAIRLRIYAGILSNLPRNPHCYCRWVGEEFNLYAEFFNTCTQLDPFTPSRSEPNSDVTNNSMIPLLTEFYTSMLTQVCASVCGLPSNCYYYLEQALLQGLFVRHPWTNLFVADVWCFLVRYGPGELCWQYVNLFASVIQQMSVRLSTGASDRSTSEQLILQLDRLGRLLSRLLVFLTPKQQSQFFGKYPLNEAALHALSATDTGPGAPMLWRFVPLVLPRLQKPAQSTVEEQLKQRLIGLASVIERRSAKGDPNLQLAVESALALRLTTSLDTSWRESNAPTLVRLTTYFLNASASLRDNPVSVTTVFCSPVLLTTLQCPLSALSSLTLQWSFPSPDNCLLNCDPFLRWLANACLTITQSSPRTTPLLSFVTLRSWHAWIINMDWDRLQHSRSYPDWLKIIASAINCVSPDLVSPICQPVLDHMKQVLTTMASAMDVENASEDKGISECIQQVHDSLNRLECEWNSECTRSSVNVNAVRKLGHRFERFLRNLDLTNKM